jgi:hypothetical protein
MEQRPLFGLRDLLYLVVLALVLAAWGWDRGRLATEAPSLVPPPMGGGSLAPGMGGGFSAF